MSDEDRYKAVEKCSYSSGDWKCIRDKDHEGDHYIAHPIARGILKKTAGDVCGVIRKSWMEGESDGPACTLPKGHMGSHSDSEVQFDPEGLDHI